MNPNNECKCKKVETLQARPDCPTHGMTSTPTEECEDHYLKGHPHGINDKFCKLKKSNPTEEYIQEQDESGLGNGVYTKLKYKTTEEITKKENGTN